MSSFLNYSTRKTSIAIDYDGSLLHAAAMFWTVKLVKFLVEKGAEVDRFGGTFNAPALTYAAEEDVDIVRYLIEEAGATPDLTHPMRNPLLRAIEEGKIDIVEYLLNLGVAPHLTYRLPTGKLLNAHVEAELGRRGEITKLLEKHGCRRPIDDRICLDERTAFW